MKSITVTLSPLGKAEQIRDDKTANSAETLHFDALSATPDSLPMTLAPEVTVGPVRFRFC
jgi:hypothetical protein